MADWFAPKRFGYGAGLPIRWQGWAVVLAFLTAVGVVGVTLDGTPGLQAAILLPLVGLLLLIAGKTTRGGWRWRWGEKE